MAGAERRPGGGRLETLTAAGPTKVATGFDPATLLRGFRGYIESFAVLEDEVLMSTSGADGGQLVSVDLDTQEITVLLEGIIRVVKVDAYYALHRVCLD